MSPSRSRAIYKYVIPWADCKIQMPVGAVILSCGHQDDVGIVIWANVDPTADMADRQFYAVNTGQEIRDDLELSAFIGTVTSDTGIVWHVYEVYR